MKLPKLARPKRLKGKIFGSDVKFNECECGRIVESYFYDRKGWCCALGFCECGNLFVAQFPRTTISREDI